MRITKDYLKRVIKEEIDKLGSRNTMTGDELAQITQTAKQKGEGNAAAELAKGNFQRGDEREYVAKNDHSRQTVNIYLAKSFENLSRRLAQGEKFDISDNAHVKLSYGAADALRHYGFKIT